MLRDYQLAAVDAIKTWCTYKESPCIANIATGGGKTHIINALAEYFYSLGQRVCILAHRKELLEQTGDKLNIPFGYYSASLGEKDTESSVIIAGIQSIFNKELDKFDVIIVDECHHLPNSDELGRYWQFIVNHQPCKLIGLTATPYRLGSGLLSWGEIVYEASYKALLEHGYLTKITNKVKDTPDLSKVKLVAGEYNEGLLANVMEDPELIDAAVKNIISYGLSRNSVLIFCVNVAHAEILTQRMQENGLDAAVLHGQTPQSERDAILQDFKDGKLKHLINCEILLEGFDAPNVDMIVCLRPTKSKSLWEQMLGRGVRKHQGKEDCFLLDMAGNLMEHGGLGSPIKDKSKKEYEKSNGKICPECETFTEPATIRVCPECNFHWPEPEAPKASHSYTADTESSPVYDIILEYMVNDVFYREHTNKKNGNKSIKVSYKCNYKYGAIDEWISPHSESDFARSKAKQFMKERGLVLPDDFKYYTLEQLISYCPDMKKPIKIVVNHSEKFPRIIRYIYEETSGASNPEASFALDDEILF